MNRKKYIRELFELVGTDSILIITKENRLKRVLCPFRVIVIVDVPGLEIGNIEYVTAVKMDIKLIDIYIVKGKAYYHFNFELYFSDS